MANGVYGVPPRPTRIRLIMALSGGSPHCTGNARMRCTTHSSSRRYRDVTACLKAFGLDFFRDQGLEFLDVVLLLLLQFAPQCLDRRLALSVGDILVETPERVETLAQVLNQVMVVIRAAHRFANVLEFF